MNKERKEKVIFNRSVISFAWHFHRLQMDNTINETIRIFPFSQRENDSFEKWKTEFLWRLNVAQSNSIDNFQRQFHCIDDFGFRISH